MLTSANRNYKSSNLKVNLYRTDERSTYLPVALLSFSISSGSSYSSSSTIGGTKISANQLKYTIIMLSKINKKICITNGKVISLSNFKTAKKKKFYRGDKKGTNTKCYKRGYEIRSRLSVQAFPKKLHHKKLVSAKSIGGHTVVFPFSDYDRVCNKHQCNANA